ncbi:MAG: DUF362 domain-containing protein [Bacteroidales bacterium]|nr:DUF362 domain-containing protein [Bacteroidales bacterium]
MQNKITRRKFVNLAATFGSLSLLPGSLFRKASAATLKNTAKVIVAEGRDYYKATVQAVEALGGISSFVSSGSKVGLLINGDFTNPGTYTNPDISFAVLKMCFDAGASEVMVIGADNEDNWKKSAYYESHSGLLQKTTRSQGKKVFAIEKGLILKEAEMIGELLDLDTLINIPISKHHDAAFLTCSLKNMMGLCSRATNVLFHSATGKHPTDNNRLAQCIADVNTLRLADLTVVDSTAFIINSGPHGPGEVIEEHKVLASSDPVALDAVCATFLEYDPGMVMSTEYAAAHQLGIAELENIELRKILVA